MKEKDYTYKSNYRIKNLTSCSLDLDYFKKLYEILKKVTEEGAEIEISQLRKKEGETDENFEKLKNDARKFFKVSIQIFGAKGENIFTESPDVFDDSGLPDTITKITFDNTSKFKAILQQSEPINKFRIEFDFTKQRVFNFNFSPSEATPNKSFLSVSGENETWVSGVYNKVIESLEERSNKHGWLHVNNIYDLFLWFLIIPLSLILLYNINQPLPPHFAELSAFFKVACYIYFFIVTLNIFRIVFNYARWIFPNIELITSPKKGAIRHRIILGAILLGVLSAFIYNLIKAFFLSG
jgi:hypothetical protein